MTRKHFQLIASALEASRPPVNAHAHYNQWKRDVEAMADVCAGQNGLFNRAKFLTACGVQS